MTNHFEPAELLKLSNDYPLLLRPTNILRYGLEAYTNSIQVFTHGMVAGKHEYVDRKCDASGKDVRYVCKKNVRDGWNSGCHRQVKLPGNFPKWMDQPGIFVGDCKYFCKKPDDMRRHYINQHPEISKDYLTKCPACHYSDRTLSAVRVHMNSCPSIYKFAESGCDVTLLCPKYLDNIEHWSSEKISGGTQFQKPAVGDHKDILKKLRELTGTTIVKDVNTTLPADVETLSTQSFEEVPIDDLLHSDDSYDAADYGPPQKNNTDESVNVQSFDVNQPEDVMRMYTDTDYRESGSHDFKNAALVALCKSVIEKQALLEIENRMNGIIKKYAGYRLDCDFLWKVQSAVHQRLGTHIVKVENVDPFKALENFFAAGSQDAANVKEVHRLLTDYESKHKPLPFVPDEVIDLTCDDLGEKLRSLELEKEVSEANEETKEQIALTMFGKKEFEEYKRSSKKAKDRMAERLAHAKKTIKDLEIKNREIQKEKKLADIASSEMEKLEITVKSDRLSQINMFDTPPMKWGNSAVESGGKSYGVWPASYDKDEKERKNLEREERKKRKHNYLDECSSRDRSRKVMKLTTAQHLVPKPANKKCGTHCEDMSDQNYILMNERENLVSEMENLRKITNHLIVGAAVYKRLQLCSQAFCEYVADYLYQKSFKSKRRLQKFLYVILPRFVSAYKRCAIGTDDVSNLMNDVENQAWNHITLLPKSQMYAYLFCEEMILRKTQNLDGQVNILSTAKSLNLCTDCDERIGGHPPKTCKLVTLDWTEEFVSLRKSFKHGAIEMQTNIDTNSHEYKVGVSGIDVESVHSYS